MNTPTLAPNLHAAKPGRRPSLKRRLLLSLLIPMLVVLVLDAILTYAVALAYADYVHDRGLADDAITLAQLIKRESPLARLTRQASFLLEYDPDGREYFSIRNIHGGWVAGSRDLPAAPHNPLKGRPPTLYSTTIGHTALRAAAVAITDPRQVGHILNITVAENLKARHRQARQILMLAVPLQVLLTVVLLLLVWFGVNSGLRTLAPLTRRIARHGHDLSPVDSFDVPFELLPLTRTINDLFARLRSLISLHERFIADAAHQLRTPLAGLALHTERALADTQGPGLVDALKQIYLLTTRVGRTSSQLLALTRAQSPEALRTRLQPVDLTPLIQHTMEPHLHEAWRLGIDLGYEGTNDAVIIRGDGSALTELLDNLIDNALHYAGRDGVVTVGLRAGAQTGPLLSVEDSGPGVEPECIPRLGERFYRPPGALDGGTGLGLAIVCRIAERHAAKVSFGRSSSGGLRVDIGFPPSESIA